MKKFLVALAVGGIMEQPDYTYTDKEVIEAIDRKSAEDIYNKKHNCSYFYAKCLGEVAIVDGKEYLLQEL